MLVGSILVIFFLFGALVGFSVARFYVKRGAGQMAVCQSCSIRNKLTQAAAEVLENQ